MKFFRSDPFRANHTFASQVVEHLLEAWTPERRAEIEAQMLRDNSARLIEHVQLGDYDLVLWHYFKINLYAASINSGQEDPGTLIGQARAPKPQQLKWRAVEQQLQQWVDVYGKLLIGSTRPERTAQYRKLLSYNFLVGEWDDPRAGFFILPD